MDIFGTADYHCSPDYTLKHYVMTLISFFTAYKVICQKYEHLCISNLRIKSNFPSQGFLWTSQKVQVTGGGPEHLKMWWLENT